MDDAILGTLLRVVAEYGTEVCENPQFVEAILRDLSPGHRGEIAVLVGAVREGIPTGLLAVGDQAPPPSLGERFTRQLRSNLGLADDVAWWAVRIWASALAVSIPQPSGLGSESWRATSPASRPGSADVEKRITDLVAKATQITAAISDDASRALAMGMVATALAETDADQAGNLIDQARLLVESITNENAQTCTLHDLSITVAGTDPDRAEDLACSMGGLLRDDALSCLAGLLASANSDRALRLARSISHQGLKMYTIDRVITAISAAEPDRAERLARSIASDYWRVEALCHLAAALSRNASARAVSLLDETERLAESLTDEAAKACALSSIARTLADTDPDRAAQLFDHAEQLARSSTDESAKDAALGSLAVALAQSDPDRALDVAQSLTDRSFAVGEIAKTLAASDPDRALRLAESIAIESPQLAELAVALAIDDPDGALGLAWEIPGERWQVSAVVGIAQALAATDPGRAALLVDDAERHVKQMTYDLDKVTALIDVAATWRRR